MTKVYLIRHAEAEGNLYRRVHGQYDSLITDNGYRQIAALKERFADIPVDAVYSSDLFRTMTTARALYLPKKLRLNTRKDLREVNMGDWEDRSWAGVDRTNHKMMNLFCKTSPDFRAPHGETFPEVRERGVRAILDIAAMHPNSTVAVFAHGTFIRNTLAEFLGIGIHEMDQMGHSDNTAVSLIEIENKTVKVVFMDDNSHLNPEISTLARQNWWKKDEKIDVNLWFSPFNPEKDAAYYGHCRESIWKELYNDLSRYDGSAFWQDALRVQKQHPQNLLLAMQGEQPAGILQLDAARNADEQKGYISFLYLDPALRRNGIGVQLLGKAVSLYRPQNRTVLEVACSAVNQPALAFYEKYGFRRMGTTPGAYGTLYEMEKNIGYDNQDGVI